jgi:acetyltransferase-like isoleucine patch superfamily enzyme
MLGDHAEIGCGSVLNPGTVIGRNSNVYPLSSVRCCVSENSIYKNQGEIAEKTEEIR